MILQAIVLLLTTAGPAQAGPAPSSPAHVASSSAAAHLPIGASTQTVSSIYTGDRSRDPFLPAAMGATSSRRYEGTKSDGPEVVDIHGMMLRGILKDSKIDYALFSSESGGTYLLRGGRLYNERNKPVPGITGAIRSKQKTVELIAPDKDVQIFRLGEDDKEKEKP